MSDFVYENRTVVYFGRGKLFNLSREADQYGRNILIISGGGSVKKNGVYQEIVSYLDDDKHNLFELCHVSVNPDCKIINEGAKYCRENSIDLIIALGGGAVIDCAKAVSITALADTDDVWDIIEGRIRILDRIPVIAIPTIASSGSEMNGGAVINNNEKKQKRSIGSPCMQPICSFCVPEFTFTVSSYQTACSSADIISHIFDSGYFNRNGQMELLSNVQETVIRRVIQNTNIAIMNPENKSARENLMWSAAWGLNGFMYENLRQDPVCHRIEHEISGRFPEISHSEGIAIVMPRWLRYINSSATAEAISRFGINCLEVECTNDVLRDSNATIEQFEELIYNKWNINSKLSLYGIKSSDLLDIAENVCSTGIIESIVELNKEDIINILEMCL